MAWTKWDEFKYEINAWFHRSWMGQALYWIRTHTYNRYHLVDGRSPQNGYKWGWIDRDFLLLSASFNILLDYVDNEHPFDVIEWGEDEHHRHAKEEILDLYAWWKEGRARANRECRELLHEIPQEYFDLLFASEPEAIAQKAELREKYNVDAILAEHAAALEKLDSVDDANLLRLMAVRRFLWT
jgi:hypothetical protein